MTTQYIQYPPNKGVPTYTNLAAFPTTASDGSLAIALDTHDLYEYITNAWQLVVNPQTINAITQLTGDVTATGSASTSVPATVAFVGTSTAAAVHQSVLDTVAATNLDTNSTIVKRDSSGNFAATTITSALTGNVTGNCSGTSATFTGSLTGDVTSTAMATTVALVGGSTAAAVHQSVLDTVAATNNDTNSTIVKRDSSGNFKATSIDITGVLSYSGTTLLALPVDTTNLTLGTAAAPGANNTASRLTIIGHNAGNAMTTARYCTVVGQNALSSLTGASGDTAIGDSALQLSTGDNNTAIGQAAGATNTSGSGNTFLGQGADTSVVNLTNATAVGAGAIVSATNCLVLGASGTNVGVGTSAPTALFSVANNVKIDGSGNIDFSGSLKSSGSIFLRNPGTLNFFVGIDAGVASLPGFNNTAFGDNALTAIVGGNFNTAVGQAALSSLTSASSNTAVGDLALSGSNGDGNVGIGVGAGNTITTGSSNTFVGNSSNATLNNLTNATAIGANASVSASNCLVLGDSCNVGIGVTNPAYSLDIASKFQVTSGGALRMDTANTTAVGTAALTLTNGPGSSTRNPAGYLNITISGTAYVLPFYTPT